MNVYEPEDVRRAREAEAVERQPADVAIYRSILDEALKTPTLTLPQEGDAAPSSLGVTPARPVAGPAARETPEEILPEGVAPAEPERPVVPGPYVPLEPYAAYVKRGQAAMKASTFDQAEALFSAAAALEPDRTEAFFGRIAAMFGARNYLQAAAVLQRELPKHPAWLKPLPDPKAAYAKAEVFDRILADLKGELETAPDHPAFNFLLGYLHLATGDAVAAKPYLERAAKVRGNDASAEQALLKAIEGR